MTHLNLFKIQEFLELNYSLIFEIQYQRITYHAQKVNCTHGITDQLDRFCRHQRTIDAQQVKAILGLDLRKLTSLQNRGNAF